MKIFTKIIQGLIALYTITGAIYMMGHYEVLATELALSKLPPNFWIGLGAVQIIQALTLILDLFFKVGKAYVFNSAMCLALLSLLGSALYIAYAGFPGILWAIIPALIYVFIAYQNKYNFIS